MRLLTEVFRKFGSSTAAALVSMGESLSYVELFHLTRPIRSTRTGLVFVLLDKSLLDATLYLWCLRNFAYVVPLHVSLSRAALDDSIRRLKPDFVFAASSLTDQSLEGLRTFIQAYSDSVHSTKPFEQGSSGGLILGTSGSTGSAKFAVLDDLAVFVNADDIRSDLGLDSDTVAVATLPLSYSYGLSVLHSTLLAGGTVVFGVDNLFSRDFLEILKEFNVTHLPGVPSHHQVFEKIGLFDSPTPSLKEITQAGGYLQPERALSFATRLQAKGVKFFKMYGQTEATARMSILPAELIFDYPESVGFPVRSGSFLIAEDGEIIFHGRNVMLGYVHDRSELESLPSSPTHLMTGDMGYLKDGLLYVTGRKSRIVKISGVRVDLDQVEKFCFPQGDVFLVEEEDRLFMLVSTATQMAKALAQLESIAGIMARDVECLSYATLCYLPSGKLDRRAMLKRAIS